ncbi:hypothetical protein N9J89_02315 [Bacteroidia bacterium]|nr:hypothetical protein [Bacteroidia bacterium]
MIDFSDDRKAADSLVLKVQELKKEIGKVVDTADEAVNEIFDFYSKYSMSLNF